MKRFKTAVIFYMSYLLILFVQDTENVLTKNTHKTISHNFISQNVGFKKQYVTENLKWRKKISNVPLGIQVECDS